MSASTASVRSPVYMYQQQRARATDIIPKTCSGSFIGAVSMIQPLELKQALWARFDADIRMREESVA
jgi:hypothetical protein